MRTVLFLINGFGIEKKESNSVYDAKVMPNFDSLTRKYIFSTLSTNVRNIYDGFRNISLETDELYNYRIVTREMENENFYKNPIYQTVDQEFQTRKCKLHILCFIDTSLHAFDQIRSLVKRLNKMQEKKIFLHIVLTSDNYEDYPNILDIISKINIELNTYVKIGMIMGLENILNNVSVVDMNFLLRNMISELGEKWSSFKQKLDVSYGLKQKPLSVKPFVVNGGFSINNDDLFLIWNYDSIDISNFITGIRMINYGEKKVNKIGFYTLFPIKYKDPIPSILNYEIAKKSLATNMKGLGFKSLIITSKDSINAINYYLNGLTSVNNPNITFMVLDSWAYDASSVVNVINTTKQELIIFNYELGDYKTVDELQNALTRFDNIIGEVYKNTEKNEYNIIISSLYGKNRVLTDSKGEIFNIIYSRVPIIYIDKFVTRKDYIVNVEGTISSLFMTAYKSIDPKYPGESLIIKKNLLYRIIFK